MAAGEGCTINITDPRYGTKCSISSTRDCAGVCDGSAYFRCTSGSTSSSCPSGQYSVNVGKQQCSSGAATNSTNCYTCKQCSYSCTSGYSTSTTSCSSGYTLKTVSASTQSGCPAKQCGKCEQVKTCEEYGYLSQAPSDGYFTYFCTAVTPSGTNLTCSDCFCQFDCSGDCIDCDWYGGMCDRCDSCLSKKEWDSTIGDYCTGNRLR